MTVVRITPETDVIHSRVTHATCNTLDVNPSDIIRARRWHDVVMARHLIRYILRKHYGWSYRLIGLYTVGGHHTTVLHSVRAMQDSIDTSQEWRDHYGQVVLALQPDTPPAVSN